MTTAVSNPSLQRALPVLITGTLAVIIAWPIAHLLGFATAIDMPCMGRPARLSLSLPPLGGLILRPDP